MARVFIGVGSNEGDRFASISTAVQVLGAQRGIRVMQMATITETEPVGGPPQGPYLNTVVEAETSLGPFELLKILKAIEHQAGRVPSAERWAPRPIDLDLLLYGEETIASPELSVPHPRMHERAFVLEPLAQLAPEFIHPTQRRTIASLRHDLVRTRGRVSSAAC